mgnify:CR=1 FL=1
MLEGLEITVIKLSELTRESAALRIDSEFQKRACINNAHHLRAYSRGVAQLGEYICCMSGGATPLGASYAEEGVPFVRVQNVMPNYFALHNVIYITPEQDAALARSRLCEGDVVLTITGSYGKAATVPRELAGANINQHSVKIEVQGVRPHFLATFLNSKFGRLQSDKHVVGVTRPALDYSAIRSFLVPRFPDEMQRKVEELVLTAHARRAASEASFASAEQLLLERLGMQHFEPQARTNSVRTLRESFLATGRIDAEFYMPSYDDYHRALGDYPGGSAPLCEICAISDDNFTPLTGVPYRYIEISNIGRSGEIAECTHQLGEDLPSRARQRIAPHDVLVSSVEGSLARCALVDPEYHQALCSTGFYVVRSSAFSPETLLVLFKSVPIQQLMMRACSGSIQPSIDRGAFERIPLPLIQADEQAAIASHVQQSVALRREAQQLLEEAVRFVEREIEHPS